MLKYKCELKVVRQDKEYIFNSDHDSPLPEIIDVLSEMRLYALNIMNEAIKQRDEALKQESKVEESKVEAMPEVQAS